MIRIELQEQSHQNEVRYNWTFLSNDYTYNQSDMTNDNSSYVVNSHKNNNLEKYLQNDLQNDLELNTDQTEYYGTDGKDITENDTRNYNNNNNNNNNNKRYYINEDHNHQYKSHKNHKQYNLRNDDNLTKLSHIMSELTLNSQSNTQSNKKSTSISVDKRCMKNKQNNRLKHFTKYANVNTNTHITNFGHKRQYNSVNNPAYYRYRKNCLTVNLNKPHIKFKPNNRSYLHVMNCVS